MQANSQERRQVRSGDFLEAAHLQLAHAAGQFDLDGFILANASGDLVATSTSSTAGEEISHLVAAFAPVMTESMEGTHRRTLAVDWLKDEFDVVGIGWEPEELSVREFYAGDQRMYLAAVGGEGTDREIGIFRVIFGIRRIWSLRHM